MEDVARPEQCPEGKPRSGECPASQTKQSSVSPTRLARNSEALENPYRAALDSLSDAMYTVDRDLRVVTVDKQPALWLEHPERNIIGLPLSEAFPFLPEKVLDQYRQAFETGKTIVTKETIVVNQKDLAVEMRNIPIQEDGHFTKVFTVMKGATGSGRVSLALMSEGSILKSMMDMMFFGVTLQDPEHNVLFHNEWMKNTFGYSVGTKCYRSYEANDQICEGCPVQMSFRDGTSHRTQRIVHNLMGKRLVLENTAIPIKDESGNITCCFEIVVDITQQKQAEEDLQEHRERAKKLFKVSPVPQIIMNAETGAFVDCNEAALQLYGYESQEEMLGKTAMEISTGTQYDGTESEVMATRYIEACRRDGVHAFEWRHQRPDGEVRDADIHMILFRYHGKPYMQCTFRDITQHKQALNALRKAEAQYRAIFENARIGIFQTSVQGRVLIANPALASIFGYNSPEELMNSVTDIATQVYVDNRDFTRVREICLKQGFVDGYETQFRRKDKSARWVSINMRPIKNTEGEVICFEGTIEDIDERKRAEDALRESRQQYRDLVESTSDLIWETDENGFYTYVSPRIRDILGYEPEEVIGKRPFDFMDHDERFRVVSLVAGLVNRRKPVHGVGSINLHKDGRKVVLEMSAVPVFDNKGQFSGYRGIDRDITERKRTEEALLQSEELYRTLIAASPDPIVVTDLSGKVTLGSRKSLELFGVPETHGIGRSIVEWVAPEDQPKAAVAMRKLLIDGEPTFGEFLLKKDDGTLFDAEVHASPIQSTDGKVRGAIFVTRDTTERKNLQAQLLHAQKMEAIGTLAGGIAHDFNNILMAIMGYAGLMETKIPKDHLLRNYVQQISSCTSKAANVTRSLLAFSRKQTIELQPHSTNMIVRDLEKLLKRLVPEDVKLTVSLHEDTTIMADMTQIDQVLINLISNSKDAMPKGGALHIETKAVELGREFRETHGFGEPGRYAMISVSDTGSGMDETTQKKIFEPFFTTKEVGKGTGLGLSIVYGIIKQHGGYVTVFSQPGRGTTFEIYLPAVKAVVSEIGRVPIQEQGGTETILVAEDNSDVRETVRTILGLAGYTVVEAKDGEDAIRQYIDQREVIDLLILDVVMPGRNGKEAYEEIRKIKPSIRALFMSGYTGDIVLDKGLKDTATNYIPKPISAEELLKKVRETLQS